MTASPAEPPLATSRLSVSVQPAKPALPIRFLYEELPNVYVFSAQKMFTTLVDPRLKTIYSPFSSVLGKFKFSYLLW